MNPFPFVLNNAVSMCSTVPLVHIWFHLDVVRRQGDIRKGIYLSCAQRIYLAEFSEN